MPIGFMPDDASPGMRHFLNCADLTYARWGSGEMSARNPKAGWRTWLLQMEEAYWTKGLYSE